MPRPPAPGMASYRRAPGGSARRPSTRSRGSCPTPARSPTGCAGSARSAADTCRLARNDSLLQAIADLSGLRLERTAGTEVTALGAGMLAGLGTECWDEAALAALPLRTDRTVLPELAAEAAQAARDTWRRALDDVVDRHARRGAP